MNERLRDGRGLMLDFGAKAALREFSRRFDAQVGYIAGEVENRLGMGALLVRPDGIVVWARDMEADERELASVTYWFDNFQAVQLNPVDNDPSR